MTEHVETLSVQDWWNPDPEDAYWMLENYKGEWLKNKHSLLTTSDPTKAIRFPSYWHAELTRKDLIGDGWASFKATQHKWIKSEGEAQ